MGALYTTETHTDDFEIRIAEKRKCKGVLAIEIYVPDSSVSLLIKDGSQQKITAKQPFVLHSFTHPITSGFIRFEFLEHEGLQTPDNPKIKKAIVRYLYCE